MIQLISRDNCNYCVKAKNLLKMKGLNYNELKIGEDITREEVIELYPNMKTVPIITLNNEVIGGYDQLNKLLIG